jgi:ATP-binding cassette subfamily B protein RaxB
VIKKKIKPILQGEMSECGLACLTMIANYHGHECTINGIRHHFNPSLHGSTMEELVEFSGELDFTSRIVFMEMEEIDCLQTPAILHWDFTHFVVVEKVTKKHIHIVDPASGKTTMSHREAADHITGYGIELTPLESISKKRFGETLSIFDLWKNRKATVGPIAKAVLITLLYQATFLTLPLFSKIMLDDILPSEAYDNIIPIASGFLLMVLFASLSQWVRDNLIVKLGSQISEQIGTNIFGHLLKLPMRYFQSRHIGDTATRFDSVNYIKDILSQGVVSFLVDGILLAVALVVMFNVSPVLSAIILVSSLIYGIIRYLYQDKLNAANSESIVAHGYEYTSFIESIKGIGTVKSFNRENQRLSLWRAKYANVIHQNALAARIENRMSAMGTLIYQAENIIFSAVGVYFIMEGTISIGTFFLALSYKYLLSSKAQECIDHVVKLATMKVHLQKLEDIVFVDAETDPSTPKEMTEDNNHPALSLKNINFGYDSRKTIINDVSFDIQEGEKVAIIGSSGAGKSTLIDLILGFIKPNNGDILYYGQNITELSRHRYREQFAAVMQNDMVFSGTLLENVTFFESRPDTDRAIHCLEAVNMLETIRELPMGLDTACGENGSTFSGGQRQRILIARALYRQPKILILDEGTANLDEENEASILNYINKMKMTVISVAHRKKAIDTSDRIIEI